VRTIGVVTVGRSDYGIYLPILRRIQPEPDLHLHLIAAGMHLSPEFGLTVCAIEEDGFEVSERVEMLLSSDTPEGIAKSMGLGTIGFAQAYARSRPDILLVLGDRFEMHAAVVAALPFRIPVAHIHGGEGTEGAIDDCLRHSITKLSHIHFVATEEYAGRVIQMGEEPWRVIVSGAPSLDNLQRIQLLPRPELERLAGGPLQDPSLLVTYHPATLEDEPPEIQFREVLAALEEVDAGVVFTYPGADAGSHAIIRMIHEFITAHPQARLAVNLGTQGYFSAMKHAAAMVGNSSSGIIEAASFRLPVVNIGSRQKGRVRGKNVIDVGCARGEIQRGIRQALSSEFRGGLSDLINPYGTGHAAETIVGTLKDLKLTDVFLRKRFHRA
jgi:UDP-hydrolysing UDP-N-acetyl-D-glucosamine 2-epimerase